MTSKNLFFKLMREDWKNRLWAPALIALASFFAYPVFLAFMAGKADRTGIQLRKPSTGSRNSP